MPKANTSHLWIICGVTVNAAMLAGVLLSASLVAGQQQTDPPRGDARKGKILFVKYCAGCHGAKGEGDGYRLPGAAPADLTAPRSGTRSDAELLKTIHEGKPNMPAWRLRLSTAESRDVLAYVRTLGRTED